MPEGSERYFSHVPQHTGRIEDEPDFHAPALQRRLARSTNRKPLDKVSGIRFLPPRIHIPDEKLDHAVLGKFLRVEILKNEAETSELQYRNAFVLVGQGEA